MTSHTAREPAAVTSNSARELMMVTSYITIDPELVTTHNIIDPAVMTSHTTRELVVVTSHTTREPAVVTSHTSREPAVVTQPHWAGGSKHRKDYDKPVAAASLAIILGCLLAIPCPFYGIMSIVFAGESFYTKHGVICHFRRTVNRFTSIRLAQQYIFQRLQNLTCT